MSNKKLTPKQKLFVLEYIKDFNATQAALKAGYSKKTAQVIGSENLKKPLIQEYITQAIDKRAEKVGIDAEFVLRRLGEIVNADPCDIINPDTGAYLPIHEWPIEWRRMLSAADVQELYEYDNDKKKQIKIGEIVKFKFVDKLKAYDMIGKHTDVEAWINKHEITGPGGGPIQVINTEMSPEDAAKLYAQEILKQD